MKTRLGVLIRLFREFFAISLFVVGGGYAILAVADQTFGRRLKWLKEGELVDKLPVFQMVPGLIAGNTAIYTGRKLAGRLGATVALLGVALPSFLVFLAVTMGFANLPQDNPWLSGAFLGLRSALTGIVAATLVKSWQRTVKDAFGYVIAVAAILFLIPLGVNPLFVIVGSMLIGIIRRFFSGRKDIDGLKDFKDFNGINGLKDLKDLNGLENLNGSKALKALKVTENRSRGWMWGVGVVLFLAVSAWFHLSILLAFLKFGCVAFGGGFVLVPMYVTEFTGPAAPLLQLPVEEFSNLIALTQTTPGPVSMNAATFFGYRLGGISGAAVATAALLLPSYILLPMVLSGLENGRDNRLVKGLLAGVRPATNALLVVALFIFAKMSIFSSFGDSPSLFGDSPSLSGDCPPVEGVCPLWSWVYSLWSGVCPLAVVLALFAGERAYRGHWPILLVIAVCASLGVVFGR